MRDQRDRGAVDTELLFPPCETCRPPVAVRFLERGGGHRGPIRPADSSTTWARFDFLSGPGMRAHLRQIVNTFIHVRQQRVLYSVVALDNETEAF